MEVRVKHREQIPWYRPFRKFYWVDVAVDFTDEERAIIEHRRLQSRILTYQRKLPPLGFGTPTAALIILSGILIPPAVIYGLYSTFAHYDGTFLTVAVVLGMVNVGCRVKLYKEDKWQGYFDDKESQITLGSIIRERIISCFATDPDDAEVQEGLIIESLRELKAYLDSNRDMRKEKVIRI